MMAKAAARIVRLTPTVMMNGVSLWALFAYFAGASGPYAPLLGWIFWLIGRSFSTLLHELGHTIAAQACGWRTVVFTVRPISVKLSHLEFIRVRRSKAPGIGGWVVAVPRESAAATHSRYAIFVAAGPLTMACVAVIAFVGSATWWVPHLPHDGSFNPVAFAFGLQAASSCIFSLLPTRAPGWASDGEILLSLRRDDDSWQIRPLLWIQALLDAKVRLRDVPRWMVDAARAMPSPPEDMTRALEAIDIGIVLDTVPVNVAGARRLIDDYRTRHGASEWLDSVDAYLAAMWEGDGLRARATLWSGAKTEEMRPMVMAAEAAVAARAGDIPTARSRLAEVRRAIRARSRFHDATFHDIGRQIEELMG